MAWAEEKTEGLFTVTETTGNHEIWGMDEGGELRGWWRPRHGAWGRGRRRPWEMSKEETLGGEGPLELKGR